MAEENAGGGSFQPDTGGSIEPPTHEEITPVTINIPCFDPRTPSAQGGPVGGTSTIDFQIWTINTREQCVIYEETTDCPVQDFVLSDDQGKEYRVSGKTGEVPMFWFNMVQNGNFSHSNSIPVFVEGSAPPSSPPPPTVISDGSGSVEIFDGGGGDTSGSTNPDDGTGISYRTLTGCKNPRIDYDSDSERLRLAYSSGGSSVYVTEGYPKRVYFKDGSPMPFNIVYFFAAPTLLISKRDCFPEFNEPPLAAKEDIPTALICDNLIRDAESSSTRVFEGDRITYGDLDDLTIVTGFRGDNEIPVPRWMMWLTQSQDFNSGKGGLVYQENVQLPSKTSKKLATDVGMVEDERNANDSDQDNDGVADDEEGQPNAKDDGTKVNPNDITTFRAIDANTQVQVSVSHKGKLIPAFQDKKTGRVTYSADGYVVTKSKSGQVTYSVERAPKPPFEPKQYSKNGYKVTIDKTGYKTVKVDTEPKTVTVTNRESGKTYETNMYIYPQGADKSKTGAPLFDKSGRIVGYKS